ncbi:Zn-dependent alcohol dehydrogenase [Allokutzneria multivorans]|uniref:Zn-dependent alcohol dehydrogenase n=1 Tax=Allokutzneria multivorans TaxID=1142134 RepID=A0ABP7R5N2_9PSEU
MELSRRTLLALTGAMAVSGPSARTTTRAALFRGVGQPLSVETIQLDPPRPTEVHVRMVAVGLCHTDLHVLRGERQVGMQPMVMGHEGAGVVEAVGAAVRDIETGDHVALTWLPACGVCRWCRAGAHHRCAESSRIARGPQLDGTYRRRDAAGRDVGSFCLVGAFAERTVVDQASVVVVDKSIPFEVAALASCGVPAGVGAVTNAARVRSGDSVVVIGVGGDGMNAVQGARLAGAKVIIAVDLHAWKLDAARTFGATHTIQAGAGVDLPARVRELTEGVGADHAFVCVDPAATLLDASRATTVGGTVVMTGLTPESVATTPVPPIELLRGQKTVIGSVYGSASQRTGIPEVLRLYRQGSLKLGELVSRRYRLDEINQGYADLAAGRNLRGVLQLG